MSTQTEVKTDSLKEVLSELFSLLETMETQNAAVQQFLIGQGITTQEKFAPYLEQAGRASSVRWLAARKRMEYLLKPIQEAKPEESKEKPVENKEEHKAEQATNENGDAAKRAPESESAKEETAKNEDKTQDKDTTAKATSEKPHFDAHIAKSEDGGHQQKNEKQDDTNEDKNAEQGIAVAEQKAKKSGA